MINYYFIIILLQILTTGGDGNVAQWDIHVDDPIQTYQGHNGVVTGLGREILIIIKITFLQFHSKNSNFFKVQV